MTCFLSAYRICGVIQVQALQIFLSQLFCVLDLLRKELLAGQPGCQLKLVLRRSHKPRRIQAPARCREQFWQVVSSEFWANDFFRSKAGGMFCDQASCSSRLVNMMFCHCARFRQLGSASEFEWMGEIMQAPKHVLLASSSMLT